MIAKVKLALPGYTGNFDDMVIYYNRHLNKMIARKKVIPKIFPDGSLMQDAFALARRLPLSETYKEDCRKYVKAYNALNRRHDRALNSWSNLWLMIIRQLAAENPELCVKNLSRQDLIDLGCGSVAAAVESGILGKVKGWKSLVAGC